MKDYAVGHNLGIDGTPTFVINGDHLVGAVSPQVFDAAVKRIMAED